MKRLIFLLILLLSIILFVYAESNRPGHTAAAASQNEINTKLDELDDRMAALQMKLNLSHDMLKNRGQIQ